MANAPLNPPLGANNLLGLVLESQYPTAYVDTGEPTPNALVASGNVDASFPLNGVGGQPLVSQGAYGLLVSAVNAATTVSWVLQASDGTHYETIDSGEFAQGQGGCIVRKWKSSLAAGSDVQGSLGNVTKLRAAITLAGSTQAASVQLAATGTP